ncbi:Do family serine endopeptidase [Flavimaricola marinus]|uniref:Putative periplasmic serine endoprotease DegP-like n=1 Tax=Flavimaricola marinus TaxID=1819565 RepID=A0A238LEI0_9RHOB|nr:Do family serine endopeptidase [Flavimaricola marinus]SMY08117.1 putative periplasmic serine endoprotease DegP-like precursor [Flavimaricola marinus]
MSIRTLSTRLALAGLMAGTSVVALAPTTALAVPAGGYADLVEQLTPGVVYIEVSKVQPAQMEIPGFDKDEFERRFGRPFPDMPNNGPSQGLGTGFVISDDGQIVTNNHVVEGASEITVRLTDGTEYVAEIIGADPLTDVALIQIDAEGLTPLSFGDSAAMRAGDEVLAIGNPFGLGNTVTSGIVSAVARDINSGPYDDFIQTDAAINRGNSGGPLFNNEGEVIGMNTAIFSPGGGSVGIGFAVPSDMITEIVADLADDGMIARGWLGVQIRPMTDEVAEVLGYDKPVGAVVERVSPDSPAASAGLQTGDIILQLNGTDLEDTQALQRAVADVDPETEVQVTLLRKGRELTLDVTLGTLPTSDT